MTKPNEGTFADIAVALYEAATSQAIHASQAEQILAGCGRPGYGLVITLDAMKRRAELIGQAHEIFKLLADNEDEVRRIIARKGKGALRVCVGEE